MSIAVAHAVCAGIGLAPLPRTMFEDPMFKDALCPVLTKYPLRHPQLYAIYVSRKHLPLKIRTFIDQLIEFTHIPRSWDASVTDDLKRSIKATPAVSLAVSD
jgi:DNA-binding transcriptional LysR family regulator